MAGANYIGTLSVADRTYRSFSTEAGVIVSLTDCLKFLYAWDSDLSLADFWARFIIYPIENSRGVFDFTVDSTVPFFFYEI